MNVEQRIAELLVSRVCHGMAAPVGAVANGVELVEEFDDSMRDEAMSLISMSANSAANHLKFFRMAYGSAGHDGLAGLATVKDLAEGIVDLEKFDVDWSNSPSAPEGKLEPGLGKILLLLIELSNEALVREGTISVEWDGGDLLTVSASGSSASVAKELGMALSGESKPEDLTARTVHGYMARKTAFELGWIFVFEQKDDAVFFRLRR